MATEVKGRQNNMDADGRHGFIKNRAGSEMLSPGITVSDSACWLVRGRSRAGPDGQGVWPKLQKGKKSRA